MARALRIQRPGGIYHLTSRGNRRQRIFEDDRDREKFLELLGELSERKGFVIIAYVLMSNHSSAHSTPGGEPLARHAVAQK